MSTAPPPPPVPPPTPPPPVPPPPPAPTAQVTPERERAVRRHPVRGVLYGLLLGLGLALLAVGQRVVAFGEPLLIVIVLAGVVIGALWSTLGPARAPTSTTPPARTAPPG
jgi:hypothetical protein